MRARTKHGLSGRRVSLLRSRRCDGPAATADPPGEGTATPFRFDYIIPGCAVGSNSGDIVAGYAGTAGDAPPGGKCRLAPGRGLLWHPTRHRTGRSGGTGLASPPARVLSATAQAPSSAS